MNGLKKPKFLYFDLGNVLLYFDHAIACRQMAAVASTPERTITAQQVRQAVFESSLENEFETGLLSGEQFYQRFCEATQTRPEPSALALASSDIFWPNLSMKPLVAAVMASRWKVGILSNTNTWHWEFLSDGRFGPVPGAFDVIALSYELKAMKPDPSAYLKAAELAGVAPGDIFYVDDMPDNVVAAREAGLDAVQYTSTHDLAIELRKRDVGMNY